MGSFENGLEGGWKSYQKSLKPVFLAVVVEKNLTRELESVGFMVTSEMCWEGDEKVLRFWLK